MQQDFKPLTTAINETIQITGSIFSTNGNVKFYQNIADHLTKGSKLVITPEWARRPIHILDLAGQSAKAKRAMQPKYK